MPSKKQVDAENSSSPQETPLLLQHYEALVTGGLSDDPAQRMVLEHLQALLDALQAQKGRGELSLSKLFKKTAPPPQGIYLWGDVGRGKSMLMGLFFDALSLGKKRRVHFHAFMQEVHGRIHTLRQAATGDPVAVLARQMAEESPLLCFDELQAPDVADATLLYRLFDGLITAEVVIVSTSNRPPATLYQGGVQQERFAKFIALLEEKMLILEVPSAEDYRLLQSRNEQRSYYWPLGVGANQFIRHALERFAPGDAGVKASVSVLGRKLSYTRYGKGIGRFTFAELCASALGAADYLTLAQTLEILILTDIPKLDPEKRNEAKRFVTLIDALYEHRVKLIASAQTPPEGIYNHGNGNFEFQRTASRLAEMQSTQYWQDDSEHTT